MSVGLYSGTSGLALGTGLYKGVSGLWGGASGLITGDGASLYLNFLAGAPLDSRVTFTRATTATFVGSNGLIQSAAINAPRFDYDPVTLAAKGLLIEEQRTNLLTYSEQFDNAAWLKDSSTVTANTTVSPDGNTNADTIIETATNSVHRIYEQINVVPGTAVTMSFYAKAKERTQVFGTGGTAAYGTQVRVLYDLSAVTAVVQSGAVTATIVNVGNGWRKCTWTATPSATTLGNHFIGLGLSGSDTYTGDGTSGIFIWGAQLEAGAFATSYIPTVASQVTRSADVASMTGTNFSSWYNPTEGTVVANFDTYAPSVADGFGRVYQIDNATNNNVIALQKNNGGGSQFFGYVAVSGAGQATLFTSAISANTPAKVATAYKLNDFGQATNGGTLVTDASGTIPTVSQMRIGSLSGVSSLNGHIQQIAYYNTRLPNATLQALTA